MTKCSFVLKRQKALSAVLVFFILAVAVPGFAMAEEETADYAGAVFGAVTKYVNMHEDYANYMAPATEQGRTGLKSAKAAGGDSMWLGINDDFMYDLPPDTPIDIIVEYFDGGKGAFNVHYDSHNPDLEWSGIVGTNLIYKQTEMVYLQDTKEWKSYTFHIEDLRAANRIYNGDLRLSTWSPRYGQSAEDVLFGSIKICRSEYLNPLKSEIGLGVPGNLMSATDETVLHIDSKNKDTKNSLSAKVTAVIYDTYDRFVEELAPFNFELEPLKEETIKIPFANPGKYGLYKMQGNIEIDYRSKGEIINQPFEMKFSISHIFEPGEGSTEYGTAHQLMAYGMGDPAKIAEVCRRGGITFLRDDLNGGTGSFDGTNWVVKQECIDGWKTLREQGVNVIGILFGPHSEQGLPVTEEDLKEWEKWVRDYATQLKGVVDILEIWNEANISAFNKNGATPEHYAEMAKRTYRIIKEINPDCTVLGLGTAAMDGLNIDYEWTKRVFAAGGGEGMDAFSIHPYEWSGTFRDKLWIKSASLLHELMAEYGLQNKEVWITEFGFSTYTGGNNLGYTRQEQYQNHTMARAIAKAYNLYDAYGFYCLADRARRDNLEENWGIIDWYQAEENPYAAKESFVAMAAFSYFINQHTETKDIIESDSVYAINFYQNKLEKDILYLQCNNSDINGTGGIKKAYQLGCSSVEVYDAYGNKIDTVYSDNGKYNFIVLGEPQYAVGNFSDFTECEYDSPVMPEGLTIDGAGGDVVSMRFSKTTERELTLKVENTVDVIENKGFVGNTAEIKIKVPDRFDQKILFDVCAVDQNGKAYYAAEHTLNITHPLQIAVEAEPASEISSNHWRVKATVKNLCYSQALSGTYKIEEPSSVAGINTERVFTLSPQEEVVYLFSLPEKVSKSAVNIVSAASLESGYREEDTTLANFTSAVYTENKPVIDGMLNSEEWTGSWIGADEEKDVKNTKNWGGPKDLSFSGNLMWDEDNLYFLAVVNDDVHYIYRGDDPSMAWSADSLQVAFDDRFQINTAEKTEFEEFTITALPNGEAVIYRSNSYYDKPNGIMENCEVAVKRYESYTVYECSIPWDELFYEDYVVDPDGKEKNYKFSVIANDRDDAGDGSWIGDGRGWIEYMSGIGLEKSAELFGPMNLKK